MDEIQLRLTSLERRVRILMGVCVALCVVFVVAATLPSAKGAGNPDRLRVRSLSVVDEHGAERLLIAAPLPNPVSGGKESPRRSPAYGIQFNDKNGNEFGAITIADDGALVHCFDWAQGEATCMFAMPSGEAGFEVDAVQGKTRGQLLLSPNGDVSLILKDGQERTRMQFRVSADGKTSSEIPGTK
jgi:hypothetical protein